MLSKIPLNIFDNKILAIEDLIYLNSLLKINIPLKDCFNLINNANNSKIVIQIQNRINQTGLINESISSYLPNEINSYTKCLSKYLSFKDSLDLALVFYQNNKNNESIITKNLAYPLFLLFISITGLYIFDLYGLDSIFGLLENFNFNLSSYQSIRKLIRIVIVVTYVFLFAISTLLLLLSKPKRVGLLYSFVSYIFPNSIINVFYTKEFVSLLIECCKRGYKTKDSMTIIHSLRNKGIVSLLAYQIDSRLIDGYKYEDCFDNRFFDKKFKQYLEIGMNTNGYLFMLNKYCEYASDLFTKKIKRLTIFIQLFVYMLIGILIIFIYQILFLPMQAMSNL